MDGEPVGIDGVLRMPLTAHADERGSVAEAYRREWIPGAKEMVQSNLSRSRAGVLRGLHFHLRQSDYWIPVSGRVVVGLVDLREGSPTQGRTATLREDGERPAALYLPPGVAHGFYAETDAVLVYLVDRAYTGEDEHGVAWDDPDVGLAWPVRDPVLSERDRGNPPLRDIAANLPRFERLEG